MLVKNTAKNYLNAFENILYILFQKLWFKSLFDSVMINLKKKLRKPINEKFALILAINL